MPRFSIIVPTYGVEGRLPLALESVLGQPFGDFELIPVHEAAADSPGGAISAAYAVRDTRVAPVESPPAGGLSAARNAGLAAAHGSYVLFLDGDDTLAPGALRAIADRLDETGDPDVLYFAHERTHWWEGGTTVVRPAGPDAPAWSAAYRRDFLGERQLTFPIGHFTDLGWNGLVALAADRTAELPDTVCVRHLLRRQGSRLYAPGDHQLELLDQVELVLARAAAGQGLSEALFGRLFAIVLRGLAHPERLPAHHRRAFFRRATHLYGLHRPAGFCPPAGRLGLQHRLLARGSYAGFRVLHAAHRAASVAPAALPRPRTPLARALNAVQRRLPLDRNLAVYRAHPGRGVGGDLVAVQAKVRDLAPRVRSVFLVAADAVDRVPRGVEHAVLGSPRAGRLLARAAYVVDDGALTDTLVKRPGSVHLRIPPGTPLKATGLDRSAYPVVAAGADGPAAAKALLGQADRWDFVLSSNRHTTETWERAFPGGYAHLEYGSPRNDVLCAATADDVARARRALGIPEGVKAVLYAPTHRDHAPGREARLDLEAFREAVGEEFVVLLRAPRRSAAVVPRGSGGRIIDVTAHPCAEEVCLAADALITDYASLMFDYAHLDRPIVILADDWEVFRETRGVCLDLPAAPPGHVARTERELADLFRDGSYADGEAGALRAAFRERFCQFDDGRAAERVVRRVFLGERPETLPPVLPLAERSPAPASAPTPTPIPTPTPTPAPTPTPTAATLVRS
ncbi:bifunctional glycosyltransferase/CDP-glycerol:glycerophosphate glycerophosphotransferase [Streptomyces caniscabiei]|uniref:CDP-glycerol glycerophosphotransferase family protein n=1 Tax=Streptomyces caniscabiei TaxID=2746961 RepID=A0ABU4N571_9ACTN|nr:CDP-glycerol glycerophosphotransferase family protein [Streptomyces caniscabiei]MBE4740228.1 CDP-glycerol glycerophosphotransferase family protein [Streptomyces caniscabiei]MBE4759118.1 CDP-glycerol glycerophosphotransferase family protein [Streptomyces caniscabiei]MBE4772988.1 CDP-glycerol glycerophosphotransferase family protein [Streptomyces caniscabiei]MBE4788124.1 CDP-glycerol glycerophosphotransferase family protein [Streptomyces caniscabiei]MBE4797346.1 CDP-glycerol glycerophosphotra